MAPTELKALHQQVGEVLRGLSALAENIEARHAQAAKLDDIIRDDFLRLRQEQHDLDEKLDCVICVMQNDLEDLRTSSSHNERSVAELLRIVGQLRKPVEEMMTLRARFAGLVFGLGIFGSLTLWLAEPFYRWVVEHNYLRQ